jgi:hypothetical protein
MERPATPQLTVGLRIVVRQQRNQGVDKLDCEVVKVGRKYATVRQVGTRQEYQFILSSGRYFDPSGQYIGYSPNLVTREQLAYDAVVSTAREIIRSAGFEPRFAGRTAEDGLVLAIAAAIEKYQAGS